MIGKLTLIWVFCCSYFEFFWEKKRCQSSDSSVVWNEVKGRQLNELIRYFILFFSPHDLIFYIYIFLCILLIIILICVYLVRKLRGLPRWKLELRRQMPRWMSGFRWVVYASPWHWIFMETVVLLILQRVGWHQFLIFCLPQGVAQSYGDHSSWSGGHKFESPLSLNLGAKFFFFFCWINFFLLLLSIFFFNE